VELLWVFVACGSNALLKIKPNHERNKQLGGVFNEPKFSSFP
jgi:hypothetical protein